VWFHAEWLAFRNHPDMCEVFFDLDLWKDRLPDEIRNIDDHQP